MLFQYYFTFQCEVTATINGNAAFYVCVCHSSCLGKHCVPSHFSLGIEAELRLCFVWLSLSLSFVLTVKLVP